MVDRNPLPAVKFFVDKMEEFISLTKMVHTFRNNVPLNLINLKCQEFNEALLEHISSHYNFIIDFFLKESSAHNERIILKFEEIARKSSETPESTKALVDLRNFINESKTVVQVGSKKDLLKSAEYMEFLLRYTTVPETLISSNSKIFRWPKHLEEILELAASRISHKLEIVENELKGKRDKFNIVLTERSKELEMIKKRDPPLLTFTEMKDMVLTVDQFASELEADKIQADEINIEEELLNISSTSYLNLNEIMTNLKPFRELWHTVLNFHESHENWCNNPFISLNAKEVQESVQNMRSTLARLSKAFLDVQGARRIVEIVLTKVEKFCSAIPILETICNPGLQERHWKKMDEALGVSIKRTPETSFSEILHYGFHKYLPLLQEINIAATQEYALEQNLHKMKQEWNNIFIQHEVCPETYVSILTGIDDIQVMLDDYLLRIQTMRGSPFIGAIEADVESWEDKLILMQDILDLWLQVQSTWLYLEPLFSSEDIMRQMPEESERFSDVNKVWNDIMEYAIKNPQILQVIEYPDMMNTLKNCNATLEGIKKGLNEYLEKKRLVFPRFFFLSNRELLEILSESKNFSKVQSHLKCFEGISSLEMTDNFDIISIISNKGEIVPLNSAISPAEAKGIVERWLDQLEDSMIQSLCDINNKAVRTTSTTSISDWIFQWPAMISFNALYINWTADTENALKENTLEVRTSSFNTKQIND
ncbi:hypothetical protein V9T40_012285 [Parthenolecanium corni]|uniref:Dynein heavy chain linker domain-containing protein n=1 Tax=Parthenolecanium corni TaxID=536013 RepID=A0AAN9TAE7_9HEMI